MAKYLIDEVEYMQLLHEIERLKEEIKRQYTLLEKYRGVEGD